jgi:hypothetical protein
VNTGALTAEDSESKLEATGRKFFAPKFKSKGPPKGSPKFKLGFKVDMTEEDLRVQVSKLVESDKTCSASVLHAKVNALYASWKTGQGQRATLPFRVDRCDKVNRLKRYIEERFPNEFLKHEAACSAPGDLKSIKVKAIKYEKEEGAAMEFYGPEVPFPLLPYALE